MAKRKPQEKKNNGAPESIPDGYARVSASESQAWFKPSDGAILMGELIGRFARRTESGGYYYQIRVKYPVLAMVPVEDSDEWDLAEVSPGTVVNIDERSALTELAPLCETGDRWAVYIKCLGKVKIKGNRTFWRFEVGKRLISSAQSKPQSLGSDVPF